MNKPKLNLEGFLEACIAARDLRPGMTIGGLHMFLTIAAYGKPIGYADLSEILETPYQQTAIRIALFADGRGNQPGTYLVDRVQGSNRQEKNVVLTPLGREVAAIFDDYMRGPKFDETPIFRLFSKVVREYPELTVNNWTVFLSAHVLKDEIAVQKRQAVIAEYLRLGNLPRHVEKLISEDLGLLSITKTRQDRRVNIITLSEKGRALMEEVEATLFGPKVAPDDPIQEEDAEEEMDFSM